MKNLETIVSFIELRAAGVSYDKIAQELGVSKRTLINWGAIHRTQIALRKRELFEELCDRHKIGGLQRAGYIARLFGLIRRELVDRDLSRLSTEALMNFLLKLDRRISEETAKIVKEIEVDLPGDGEPAAAIFLQGDGAEGLSGLEGPPASGSITEQVEVALLPVEAGNFLSEEYISSSGSVSN